ncbi:MAG: putative sensor protein [Pedosphaera sp.]|nr:putative sensor protein [Pedosphaera sp.]
MKKPLRILIVEDSEDDTLFLLRELERGGFEPVSERVDSLQSMASALDRRGWDIIVSDHSMPGFGSLDAIRVLKEKELDIPFIVVSGAVGEELAVKAMKAGANDYVMKSQLTRLVPAIERELQEAWDRRSRRKTEEALQRSQQELSDFFDHAAVGLHWEGPEGTILRVNQTELDMLNYSQEEYLGHGIREFHVDEGVAEDILKRLHGGETLNNYEARLRCKSGAIRHVLINANVLWENGKFIRSRCFTRDITEHKHGEEAVAYLAAIVESTDDAVMGTTLEGTILSWNAAAERIYGYAADEVKGRSSSILIPPYRPDELPELYARIQRGERVERYETVRLRKDGTAIDVSLTLSPIKDARGKVIGISAIERDITSRRREEEDRLKLIDELTVALAKIRTLRGLVPICAACKKIRDDRGYWQKVELYVAEHTEAEFTHGLCPDCRLDLYPEYPVKP